MAYILTYGAMSLVAIAALFLTTPDTIPFTVAIGVLVAALIAFSHAAVSNRRVLRFAWYSLVYARETVRISASYLYKIKVDDQYLLIRGHRYPQMQPVGGVYKIFPSGHSSLQDVGAVDDDLIPFDERSDKDLRIRIPGKFIHKFVQWFEAARGRETMPWREFYEELLATDILPHAQFPYVLAEYIGRTYRPIRFSEYANSWELLIADVYELLPNTSQLSALRTLREQGHGSIYWATASQIQRRGAIPGRPTEEVIAETAKWLL